MTKQVPFFGNTPDGMHCMAACYRSIFNYFLHKDISWEELDDFMEYDGIIVPWTIVGLTKMSRMGFDIKMIEPFDYAKYLSLGKSYLPEVFDKVELDWQIKHSNILNLQPSIPEFLASVSQECRKPGLEDIDTMLADNRIVTVTVNSHVLNNKPGYASHMILVYEKNGEEYIFHDPGLPSIKNREISSNLLWKAMGEGKQASDVTGFKLKELNT